ncbi:MAG: signal peptidase I [Thermoprotei archaeon]|nr:MAG: signal peptidase I [Thermoprotei archaeon]
MKQNLFGFLMEKRYDMKAAIIILVMALILSYGLVKFLSIALNTELPLAVVSSWSMEPTLHIGDLIIVRGVEPEIGDVVVFSRGKYIVHRVIAKSETTNGFIVITKGDANTYPDGRISYKQVKGKVVMIVPYVGVLKLLSEKFYYVFFILAFMVFLSTKIFF